MICGSVSLTLAVIGAVALRGSVSLTLTGKVAAIDAVAVAIKLSPRIEEAVTAGAALFNVSDAFQAFSSTCAHASPSGLSPLGYMVCAWSAEWRLAFHFEPGLYCNARCSSPTTCYNIIDFHVCCVFSLGLTWIHFDSLGFNWTHLDLFDLALIPLASLGFAWIHLDSLAPTGFHLGSLGLS